ncbi:MAG: M48 family metalloprotease [Nitrososphaerota archaeon]|nr:M48 family metalloprotease [Nitrososphaerota archaeon]MDG7048615.1 M48 family metalloprotease [Nitrososphaerota archaeon]MDG7051448.1 M48 family metalloprotease [Nitrososphaerota archaeon]
MQDKGGKAPSDRGYRRGQRAYVILGGMLVILPELLVVLLGSSDPVLSTLSAVLTSTVLLSLYSLFYFRTERKYRGVSATLTDYFRSGLPLYVISNILIFFTIGMIYLLPRLGFATIIYVDAVFAPMYLVLARFPIGLRMGQRAEPLTDTKILSAAGEMAQRMDVDNVKLYTVDWRRFRTANAFQVGPRRFSIYVSNYLLDNLSSEEVNAVLAHELAHAKKRHVMKSMALIFFPTIVEMNVLVLGYVITQTNLVLGSIVFAAGFAAIFLEPRIAFRFQRRFELEADMIAVRTMGDGRPLISALEKLSALNLVPGGRRSRTHPSVIERIRRIEQLSEGDLANVK